MTRPDYCPVAQEPCQAMCSMSDVRCKIRDARPQPKREWVGLTDEEIKHAPHHMVDGAYHYSFKQGAEWAEAKLRSKNT